MGASDYMVGNAPAGASYMPPQIGQQLGQAIGNLPQDYYEGQKRQRSLAVMNAFPNGIPPGANVNDIMSTIAKAGGGEYVQQLMPFMIKQQIGQQAGDALGNLDASLSHGANTAPSATPPGASTGPANLAPRAPQASVGSPAGPAPTGAMPPLSSAGMSDGNGAPTVRSIMSEQAGGRDVATQIASVARTLRLNPDAPLTPAQIQQVKDFKTNAAGLSDQSGSKTAQAAPQAPQAAPQQLAPNPALDAQVAQMTSQMNGLNDVASRVETYATRMAAVDPSINASALAKAKALREQAAAIQQNIFKLQQQSQEAQLKEEESTPAMKDATRGAPAINAQKLTQKQNELDATRFDKTSTGIQTAADAAAKMIPQLQLAKSLMAQPNFMSGAGAETNLMYKQWLARVGQDPNVALPQEAFRKVMAANILDQVANLKAETAAVGGAGRIFQSQIGLMEKAAQNPDYSPASNRLLTEIGTRLAQRALAIDKMSNTYGPLDRKFMQQVRDYDEQHPLFTPKELEDPRRIAPPEFNSFRDAFHARLPPGTPVMVGGNIVYTQAAK